MSKYQAVATVTSSDGTSTSLITGLAKGAVVEVTVLDADMWINVAGGAASVAGANCVALPQNQSIRITVDDAVTSLAGIRDSGTNFRAQVAVVS